MATSTTNPRVRQLYGEATATIEASARFFDGLTAEQAATVTEIGWTVAATVAHLAFATRFLAMQLARMKRGKPMNPPGRAIDLLNLVVTQMNRRAPIVRSVAKIRANTRRNLAPLDGWTDTALDGRYTRPFFGTATYEEGLRYSFVVHFDEHIGQIRRALKH